MSYNRAMACVRTVSALIVFGLVSLSAQQQQQPVFRSGVDLVTIDVAVLDKSGAPVAALTAGDFTVVAGNKPRRVVSADFVRSSPPLRAEAFRSVAMQSSNRRIIAPRTVIFLVDIEQIPSGEGRTAMKGFAEYMDRLRPDDRIGVMTLSDNRASPTTNRSTVRDAFSKLVGSSPRLRAREMTFGEAPGIANRDRASLMAYWSRISESGSAMPGEQTCGPPRGFEQLMVVPPVCIREAEAVIERVRFESRRVLRRLGEIAQAMDTVPDPKAIVLVSGGLFNDSRTQNDFAEFASVAERARVPVFSLLVEADGSAGGTSNTDTKRLDSTIGFGGLADLASLGRGSARRLIGDPTPVLARLDRELSGHYVLAFERDPVDREGARIDLEVRVRRPDVTVMTRRGVTPGRPLSVAPSLTQKTDLKGSVATLLRSAAAVTQVPMTIDALAMPASPAGQDARFVVAIEIGRNPEDVSAVGFQLANATGRVIADGYQEPVKLLKLGEGRSAFVAGATGTDGKFIVRVAAIDAKGEQGSLQHTFEVAPWPEGPIRLSDLMFGGFESGEFLPGAGTVSATGSLGLRLVVRDQTQKFDDVKVRVTVAAAADGGPVDTVQVPLLSTPDPLRRFADAKVDVGYYPPGEYVLTAVVTAKGAEIGQRRRIFVR